MSEKEITTTLAFDHIAGELKNDEGYYRAWHANIAMAFYDQYQLEHKDKGLREIANGAATRFLDLLIAKRPTAKGGE